MDWADELAAPGQRPAGRQRLQDAVRDGPRRQPARPGHPRRHHPRAARERHRDDAPVRRRRPRPDGRPGAPDARRHRARDGPAARPRPGPGRRRPRLATPAISPGSSSTSSPGLGIHPDRYYWMSDIYPTGAMDPYIRTGARPGRTSCATSTGASPTSSTPTRGTRSASSARPAARSGTTIVTEWDGERVFYECRRGPRDLGARLRLVGLDLRRSAGRAKLPWNLEWAAQWSLFGVTIEPCGKDLVDGGRVARPVATRSPARCSSASRRSTSPYEFLNIGGKKMSTSKGRGAAAHTIAEVIPPEQLRFLFLRPRPNQAIEFDPEGTDAIPRLFDEFDRFAAATAGREVKGELPPGLRGDLPLLAARPGRGRRRRGGRVPAGVRAPRAARPDPGRRRRGPGRGREGESR